MRDSRESKDTPAFGVNAAKVEDKKKGKKKDPKEVTCYNCNKLEHYADQYQESQKSKNYYQSQQSPCRRLVLEKRLWNISPAFITWSSSRTRIYSSFDQLKEWGQCHLSNFRQATGPPYQTNRRRGPKNWRHYARHLWNGSCSLFGGRQG